MVSPTRLRRPETSELTTSAPSSLAMNFPGFSFCVRWSKGMEDCPLPMLSVWWRDGTERCGGIGELKERNVVAAGDVICAEDVQAEQIKIQEFSSNGFTST